MRSIQSRGALPGAPAPPVPRHARTRAAHTRPAAALTASLSARAAMSAASLVTLAMSAPAKPGVSAARRSAGARRHDAGAHSSPHAVRAPRWCKRRGTRHRRRGLATGPRRGARASRGPGRRGGRGRRTAVEVHRLVQLDLGQVHAEDLLAPVDVGAVDGDLAVEAACQACKARGRGGGESSAERSGAHAGRRCAGCLAPLAVTQRLRRTRAQERLAQHASTLAAPCNSAPCHRIKQKPSGRTRAHERLVQDVGPVGARQHHHVGGGGEPVHLHLWRRWRGGMGREGWAQGWVQGWGRGWVGRRRSRQAGRRASAVHGCAPAAPRLPSPAPQPNGSCLMEAKANNPPAAG